MSTAEPSPAELLERERQARREAEAERDRLKELLMQAPAFISLFRGPEHVYSLSNVRNNQALGRGEVLGKPIRQAVPEAEHQGFTALLDRVYATGEPFSAQEMPVKLPGPDGKPREYFLHFIYQPTRDAHGAVDGAACFGFDVTALVRARKKAELLAAELERAEANSRFLSEASAVLGSSLDHEATLRNVARLAVPTVADWCLIDLVYPDGTLRRVETLCAAPEDAGLALRMRSMGIISQANPRYPVNQAFAQGRSVLIPELTPALLQEGALSEEHARLVEAAQLRSLIVAPMMARGRVLGVLTFATSRSGRRYTAAEQLLLEDLARRAALSIENARLYHEAQEAIRLRDEFLSIASHELKTPLTPLSLKLQMLSGEVRRQPESSFRRAVEEYIAVGSRQVKRLSELVNELLDVARIAGGRLRLELEEVELAALVKEVLARHEPEAARAGSRLVLEAAPVEVVGCWDRLRLEQVITNLVDNAIKYGSGKPVHVSLEAEGGQARLRVRDEGIGIAPEHLSRIFERFERAVSERHYGGLGLGLYITRTIVEALGGTIQVESALGLGATFTVELPCKAAGYCSSEEPPGSGGEGGPRET